VPDNEEQRSDEDMPTYPASAVPSFRTLWLIAIAAMTALALWLLLPGDGTPSLPVDGNASLPPSLRVDGTVASTTAVDGSVVRIEVPLALRGDDAIRLTDDGRIHAVTFMAETASAAVPASYTLTWATGDGDQLLEAGERALLTVDLPEGSLITAANPAKLVIRPLDGPSLTIEDVLP
jgi:hypothetical protein